MEIRIGTGENDEADAIAWGMILWKAFSLPIPEGKMPIIGVEYSEENGDVTHITVVMIDKEGA